MINKVKLLTPLFLMMWIHISVKAQINWGDYSQTSYTNLSNKPKQIGLIVSVRRANDSFSETGDMDYEVDQLLDDPNFKPTNDHNIIARSTFDTAKVHFFLNGINKNNASTYEYRVVENANRVLVPWIAIYQFANAAVTAISGFSQIAYLGGYTAAINHRITVQVRKIGNDRILSTAIVRWKSTQPIVTNIYETANFDAFLQHLQYPWANRTIPKNFAAQVLSVPSTNTNLIFSLKGNIYSRNQVQYQVLRNDKVVIPWRKNDYDNSFIWLKENRPGNYKLNIRYVVQPQHVASYQFEIEAAWYQSNTFKVAAGILITAGLGAFLFLILLLKQRRLTRNEVANKTKLQLELKAIHAQLNPHFVFNALSSIQGLVNKQDIKGANSYLVEFAKLMRESLKSGNNDDIPLKREIDVLHTYIKLEQLRFGFSYEIHVDEQINTSAINIPSLLLQPLVENAIKHGVSANQQNGKIEIDFKKVADHLLIIIKDNGKGFNGKETTTGYGLKLTQERIQLLNALKPEQKVSLQIESQTGTAITLTFNHWFL